MDSCFAKIKVVHVLHSFGTGGMESIIATVIRQASAGFQHIIVCLTVAGDSTKLLPSNIQIIELHKPPGNSLIFFWKLCRRLYQLKPDIVHTYNWSGMDGIIAARLAGIKEIVQSEHGWDMKDQDGLNAKRIIIRRFLSGWAWEFTCVSKQMTAWLTKTVMVRCPVTHIYNGVDTSGYCPGNGNKVRQRLGLSSDCFVVGIVGRLDPIKNHPMLFRVFAQLQKQRPDAYLLVIGDGPEREKLLSMAGDNVQFLGNRQDVPELLRAFDVFILSSMNEGISCAITEAMATGVPVIASDVGGNPELVDHEQTGFLFSPEDELGLLQCVNTYYNDRPLARKHGLAGREKMLELFTNEKMVAEYEQVYRRVVAC